MTEPSSPTNDAGTDAQSTDPTPLRVRYRIRFAKSGLLRWTSHRDLARLWERLVRRAALVLSMTEGFHPKPRIGFPSALALGVEGLDEVVELELAEQLHPAALLERLAQDDQPGLSILSVRRLPERFGKAQLQRSDYIITVIDTADLDATQQAIDRLLQEESVSVKRKQKTVTVKVAEQIPTLRLLDGNMQLSLAASDAATLRPGDVLDLLDLGDWIEQGATVTRTHVVLAREFETDDPDLIAIANECDRAADQASGPLPAPLQEKE